MADHRNQVNDSDPFKGLNIGDLTGRMVDDTPRIVERVVEVEVPYPITIVETDITQIGNVGITPTGLIIPESGISKEEWAALFNILRDVRKSWQFMIGDWFAYGADNFAYSYEDIAKETGYKESTVKTFASVCRNVARLTRINLLDFAHHRAVSTLAPELQITALKYAEENHLSVRDFRAYLGHHSAKKKGRKKGYNLIDNYQLNRLRNATLDDRLKVAARLRQLADELERIE